MFINPGSLRVTNRITVSYPDVLKSRKHAPATCKLFQCTINQHVMLHEFHCLETVSSTDACHYLEAHAPGLTPPGPAAKARTGNQMS